MADRRLGAYGFVLLAAGPAWAGNGSWTGNGPDGGQINEMAIAPSGSELYAATQGGVFRSVDGGLTWERAENGLIGNTAWSPQLALDTTTPLRLYLTDNFGRIYRTDNGADDWTPTAFSLAAPNNDAISDLAVSPGNGLKILATTFASGLHGSNDGGASYATLTNGLPPSSVPLRRVAIDPRNPLRVLVGTDGHELPPGPQPASIFFSNNGAVNFNGTYSAPNPPVGEPAYFVQVRGFAFSGPLVGGATWAAINDGLLRSADGGNSWTPVTWSGPPDPGKILGVTGHPTDANKLWLVGPQGVYRSINGGLSWSPINSGLQPSVGGQASVNALNLHPNYPTTPTLWVSTQNAGVFVSADDGANWAPSHSGLAATLIRTLAVHQNNRNLLFAGYGDALTPSPALYRSFTSDISNNIAWLTSNTNLLAYQIRSLAIDPSTANNPGATHIYAGGRACPSSLASSCFGPRNGGLYKSINTGASWSTIDNGVPLLGGIPDVGTIRSVVLDPRSCSAPPPSGPCPAGSGPLQTVYFAANGNTPFVGPPYTTGFRIGKSSNAGAAWSDASNGLPQPIDYDQATFQVVSPVPLVIDPLNPQILYTGTFVYYDSIALATPSIANGVFKSINGGATWLHASDGLPRFPGSVNSALDVLSLAIHPSNPQVLWASTQRPNSGVPGAIYKTTSGAQTGGGPAWVLSNGGVTMPDVRALVVDPNNPNIVYAAGGGTVSDPGGVFRSLDGGANWTSISTGLPADAGATLAIDPVDPRLIHAGTNSGVYSILQLPDFDLDGVPDVTENAVPSAGQLEGSGDGNGDGTADRFQGDVGSSVVIYKALNVWTKNASGALDKGPPSGGFFTTDILGLQSVGDCDQAYDVHAPIAGAFGIDRNPNGRPRAYPHEAIRLEIPGCQHAVVEITFHLADFGNGAGWSFRAYAPTTPGEDSSIRWFDFTSRANRVDSKKWRIVLDAGQSGSYRPGGASILFVGGPAYDEQIFANGFQVPPSAN